ncbi:MAG: hypothetical protein PHS82_14990 [Lachnospiraceae bacterium]|nr:hypothetical protein [Lachnospiraceae bacterium]
MSDEDKWSIGEGGELPIGFGLNLAANGKAMKAFAEMSDGEKEQVVEESRKQQKPEDMEKFVNHLGK